jgi:hypothetical protein
MLQKKGATDSAAAMIDTVGRILTPTEPFGPRASESLFHADLRGTDILFDRSNLIYAQTVGRSRPAYIVGRKGAGKTAFLRSSASSGGRPQVVLETATVYSEMAAALRHYTTARGPLFVPQVADVWLALFEHVALYYAVDTMSGDDPPHELQTLWDYLSATPDWGADATTVSQRYLAELERRIDDRSIHGLTEVIDGMSRGGIAFAEARKALCTLLSRRESQMVIVMDNLEDLHAQLPQLDTVLAGLFHAVGVIVNERSAAHPFTTQLCLPSELWDRLHLVSANPEKDFGGNYLTLYWSARELLHLVGSRYQLFMEIHHPAELDELRRRCQDDGSGIALLRASLPGTIQGGLGILEDPVAYLLRHTQLLPRHLIEILNSVFTAAVPGSTPWTITPDAIRVGTRSGERIVIEGIFAAHRASFPEAPAVLRRLVNRLAISFPARELRKVFNREGIKKVLPGDFDDFMEMLIAMGVLGVKVGQTAKYNKAKFQYTFESSLNALEDQDELCFHPLFTRYLFEQSIDRQRQAHQLPTYPFGTDPADHDYRDQIYRIASRAA